MKCVKCNREYPDERPVCPYCHTPNENVENLKTILTNTKHTELLKLVSGK